MSLPTNFFIGRGGAAQVGPVSYLDVVDVSSSSGQGQVSLNIPSGTQAGDLIVVFEYGADVYSNATSVMTSGFTVGEVSEHAAVDGRVLYKIAKASDANSTYLGLQSSSNTAQAQILVYRANSPITKVTPMNWAKVDNTDKPSLSINLPSAENGYLVLFGGGTRSTNSCKFDNVNFPFGNQRDDVIQNGETQVIGWRFHPQGNYGFSTQSARTQNNSGSQRETIVAGILKLECKTSWVPSSYGSLLSGTISQSSVYAGNQALTYANATDWITQDETSQTGTDSNSGTEWIQIDFGQQRTVNHILLGAPSGKLVGGWSSTYTFSGTMLQYNSNGSWVDINTALTASSTNFSTYLRDFHSGWYTDLPVTTDKIRLFDNGRSYLAATEFRCYGP